MTGIVHHNQAAEKKLLYQKEKCMKMDAATAYYYEPEFYLEN